MREKIIQGLRSAMELILLGLVCISPWALGSVRPVFQFWLYVGLGGLLVLWALRILVEWRFRWAHCPVAICLVGLFLFGILQTLPLSSDWLEWLSPATAKFYQDFLPTHRETLVGGETIPEVPLAGTTLSLYPGATKWFLSQLLAVFLLFAVVRNNIASWPSLWRLGLVVVVNATVMTLFGVVHYYTSAERMVYWVLRSAGAVFGPYINRNHFAFYVNICIGLGVGLLLALWEAQTGKSTRPGVNSPQPFQRLEVREALARVLNNPHILGVCLMLATMMGGVVFCQSRGGVVSRAAGALVGGLLLVKTSGRWTKLFLPLLMLALVLPVVVWFGLEQVESRYSMVWKGDALQDDRWNIWSRTLSVAKDYPIWGTGYGTFRYVEPMARRLGDPDLVDYEHAHNDYVEAFVEGGIVRLLLSLLIIVFVYRLGMKALQKAPDGQKKALVVGVIWAFTTVVVHNIFDFGIHMPANALLATVVIAYLCALGSGQARDTASPQAGKPKKEGTSTDTTESPGVSLSMGGLAPILAVAAILVLGWVLCREGWRLYQGTQTYLEALVKTNVGRTNEPEVGIPAMEATVGWIPLNARRHLFLAELHDGVYRDEERRTNKPIDSKNQICLTACLAGVSCCDPGCVVVPAILTRWKQVKQAVEQRKNQARQKHLIPALKHYVIARDLCPLLDGPHVMIAAYRQEFTQIEPTIQYLERAQKLRPQDPEIWYLSGIEQLKAKNRKQAFECWKKSLQRSDEYCSRIIRKCQKMGCSSKELISAVIPASPRLLTKAGELLHPEDTEKQKPFWAAALVQFDRSASRKSPKAWYLKAKAHQILEQPEKALKAYKAGLARDPKNAEGRYRYARLLFELHKLPQARREVSHILRRNPNNPEALALYKDINQAMRKRRN